jgi:opacity protein-like surface antigen
MTKKIASAVAAAAIALAGTSAFAADLIVDTPAPAAPAASAGDWYVSLFAGGVWSPETTGDYYGWAYDVTTDAGYALGIAVGTKVFDALRVEVELSGTSTGISDVYTEFNGDYPDFDGSVSALYLLGNAWFDLDVGGGFTPYLGGGVGLASVSVDFNDWSWNVDGTGFAYQLGAGVKFDVSDNLAIDLGYRFKSVPGLTVEDSGGDELTDIDLTSHVIQAGLTFSF